MAAAVSRRTMNRAAEREFENVIKGANVVGSTYQGRLDVCWQASVIQHSARWRAFVPCLNPTPDGESPGMSLTPVDYSSTGLISV